jgi:hypothetical protein
MEVWQSGSWFKGVFKGVEGVRPADRWKFSEGDTIHFDVWLNEPQTQRKQTSFVLLRIIKGKKETERHFTVRLQPGLANWIKTWGEEENLFSFV